MTNYMVEGPNIPPGETIDSITISRLAEGPSRQVTSWNAYGINGYTYYTHAKDSKFVNQNIGVRIEALIEEIWELDYGRDITVALFRCRWIKQHQLNEIGLRVLNLENLGYQDDPWVLTSRVAQVFYMSDPQSNLPPKEKDKACGCL